MDELTKQTWEALQSLIDDKQPTRPAKRAALAVVRAYQQGYFKVPVNQLSDDELLSIANFGKISLLRVREVIGAPVRESPTDKEFETITPERLIKRIKEISKGYCGVMIVPLTAWRNICAAYDSPLTRIIEGQSMQAQPVHYSKRKLGFRVEKK